MSAFVGVADLVIVLDHESRWVGPPLNMPWPPLLSPGDAEMFLCMELFVRKCGVERDWQPYSRNWPPFASEPSTFKPE